jgi:hypothetical protein
LPRAQFVPNTRANAVTHGQSWSAFPIAYKEST